MEYTTSGLENPLAYLLVGLLFVQSQRSDNLKTPVTSLDALTLGTVLAALALTRLDLLIIALPVALLWAWQQRSRFVPLCWAAVAFALPLVAWFSWSYVTYATLLPNTFAAKRNLLIPTAELLVQGFRYVWVSIERDPVTGMVLAAGLMIGVVRGARLHRAWTAGALLYLSYVVYIGGDFMAGRFLAVPTYLAVLLATAKPANSGLEAAAPQSALGGARPEQIIIPLVTTTLVVLLLTTAERRPVSLADPQTARWDYEQAAGVADERGFYMEHSRGVIQLLMSLGSPPVAPPIQPAEQLNLSAPLADIRTAANGWPDAPAARFVVPREVGVKCGMLGTAGILTGPQVHWVDRCGLTDRFLAEQPYRASGFRWRVGHYMRRLPDGYLEAIAGNDPSLVGDPQQAHRLADVWSKIRD